MCFLMVECLTCSDLPFTSNISLYIKSQQCLHVPEKSLGIGCSSIKVQQLPYEHFFWLREESCFIFSQKPMLLLLFIYYILL